MTRMIRKQIYIKTEQDAVLKKRARMLGVTEAEVIRKAIDGQTVLLTSGVRNLEAWEEEKVFISKRVSAGHARGGRRFHRRDVYEERLKRYGK